MLHAQLQEIRAVNYFIVFVLDRTSSDKEELTDGRIEKVKSNISIFLMLIRCFSERQCVCYQKISE